MNYMAPEVIKLALLNPGNQTYRSKECPAGIQKFMNEKNASESVAGYSQKVDIWSFGMIVYELVALQLPYANLPIVEASRMIECGCRPLLPPSNESFLTKQILDECSCLVEIFEKCAVLDPDMRISATQVLDMLNASG